MASWIGRTALLLSVLCAAAAIVASPARATFPGGNGEISVAAAYTNTGGGGFDRKHLVFDPLAGRFDRAVPYTASKVRTRVSYSPDGGSFVSNVLTGAFPSATISVGDAETLLPTGAVFDPQNCGAVTLPTAFLRDGRVAYMEWLTTCGGGNSASPIKIWSSATDGSGKTEHHELRTNQVGSTWLHPNAMLASPTADLVYLDNEDEGTERGIHQLDLRTNQLTRIVAVENPAPPGYGYHDFRLHDVSPDGRYLLYGYETHLGVQRRTHLAYFDTITRSRHDIADSSPLTSGFTIAPPSSITFSPDGTQVAYLRWSEVPGTADRWEVRLADVVIDAETHALAFANDRPISTSETLRFNIDSWDTPTMAWRANTAAFDVEPLPGGGPGQFRFTNRSKNADGDAMLVQSWDFGDGPIDPRTALTDTIIHEYLKPGRYTVTLTVRDPDTDEIHTGTKILTVKAPELSVALDWDEEEVEVDGRLALNTPFDAQLKVKASGDGVGPVTGITFDDEVLLEWTPGERVEATAETVLPEPFDLEPGETRTIDVTITPRTAGRVTFLSAVTGSDSAATPRPVTAALSKPVRIGHDFTVDIQTKYRNDAGQLVPIPPEGIELEVLTEDEGEVTYKPRDIQALVNVKNVSGADAEEVKLDLREILRSPRDGAPVYTEHGVELVRYRIPASQDPSWKPIPVAQAHAALDLPIGSGEKLLLAEGGSVQVEVEGRAIESSVLDLRGVVRGVDRTGETPQPRSGHGTRTVRINQDVVLVVNEFAAGGDPVTKAGSIWQAEMRVCNVTHDVTVTMLALMHRSGNVIGRRIGELGGTKIDAPGMTTRLEPQECIPVQADFSSDPLGGTRAYVDLGVGGWVLEDPDGVYADPEDQRELDPMEVVTRERADGTPANFFLKHVDTSDPKPEEFASISDAAWVFTDGFMRGFSKWAESTIQVGRKITTTVVKADVYAWQFLSLVQQHMDPRVREQSIAEVARLIQQLRNVSYDDAKARVDAEAQKMFMPSVDAYYASDWRKLTHESAKLLGEQAASKAVEVWVPQLLAARYAKHGGKAAVLAAQEAQEASFLTRINRFGRKGYKPGDRVNWQHATDLWGIDRLTDARLLEYAQKKRIVIAVRDRSPGSKQRLLQGALPKIEKVKAKNVNDIDVQYLGFSPDHKDLAMIKRMPNEHSMQATLNSITDLELRKKVESRYLQRAKEYEELLPELQQYQKAGEIPVPSREFGFNPNDNAGGTIKFDGVWDTRTFELPAAGTNGIAKTTDGLPAFQPRMAAKPGDTTLQPFTGDMDPIAFLDESGQVLSLERRMEVYEELAELGLQHPESLTWDNAAGRANYLKGFDMANDEAEALLAYTPDGTRRAVMFDSRKSHWGVDQQALKQVSFYLDGLDRVGKAKEVAGRIRTFVKLILPPQQPYMGPGKGNQYGKEEGLPLLRRNPDGSYDSWTVQGGWEPYVPAAGEVIEMLPQTALLRDAKPGETYLDIIEREVLALGSGVNAWFEPGDEIVINPGGDTEERLTVNRLGSIVTTRPLKYAHAPGELIGVVPRPRPPAAAPQPTPGPGEHTPPVERSKPAIVPAKAGAATLDRARTATVASIACPAHSGACTVTVPRTVTHTVGKQRFTATIVAPATIQEGGTALVKVRLTARAAKRLTRRTTAVALAVSAANAIGTTSASLRASVAKPKGAASRTGAVVRVPKRGTATIGTVSCPAGAGTCRVASARTVSTRIGGRRVALRVTVPRTVRAGRKAPIRITVPAASRTRLATSPAGAAPVTLTLKIANEGGRASGKVAVRLRR